MDTHSSHSTETRPLSWERGKNAGPVTRPDESSAVLGSQNLATLLSLGIVLAGGMTPRHLLIALRGYWRDSTKCRNKFVWRASTRQTGITLLQDSEPDLTIQQELGDYATFVTTPLTLYISVRCEQ